VSLLSSFPIGIRSNIKIVRCQGSQIANVLTKKLCSSDNDKTNVKNKTIESFDALFSNIFSVSPFIISEVVFLCYCIVSMVVD
jgi:hypothetical protein